MAYPHLVAQVTGRVFLLAPLIYKRGKQQVPADAGASRRMTRRAGTGWAVFDVENGATPTATINRLVRLLDAVRAKLTPEVAEGVARVMWQAEMTHEERIFASQDAYHKWIVQTETA